MADIGGIVRSKVDWAALFATGEMVLSDVWEGCNHNDQANITAWRDALAESTLVTSVSTGAMDKDQAQVILPALFHGIVQNDSVRALELHICEPEHIIDMAGKLNVKGTITSLNLSESRVESAGVIALARTLRSTAGANIKTLDLSYCSLGDGASALADALDGSAQAVQAVHAGNGAVAMAESAAGKACSVATLLLQGNCIGAVGAQELGKALVSNGTVTSLNFKSNSVGDKGATAIAAALKAPTTAISLLILESNSIGTDGAKALGAALEENKTVTTLDLSYNDIDAIGAEAIAGAVRKGSVLSTLALHHNSRLASTGATALAMALRPEYSCRITLLDLSNCTIGEKGAASLAAVLEVNTTVEELNLDGNQIGSDGAAALGKALAVNSTVQTMTLSSNMIGSAGAVALAVAFLTNKTVVTFNIDNNQIGDAGVVALCLACKVPESKLFLSMMGNAYHTLYARKVLSSMSGANLLRVRCDVLRSKPEEWTLYLNQLMIDRDQSTIELLLRHFLLSDALDCERDFAAVMAAWLNDTPSVLKCLRRWPNQAAQVIEACQAGFVQQGCLHHRTQDRRGAPADLQAIQVAKAVSAAVHGKGATSIANVHICGEGYAGKTTTRLALVTSFNSVAGYLSRAFMSSPMIPIPLASGRTLGMVTDSLDSSGFFGESLRVLFHDYGGQEEFRANHAAHLAAPNSVYLLVVPLWDMRPGPNHDQPMKIPEIKEAYLTWLKFINSIVPRTGEQKAQCITALNFADQVKKHYGDDTYIEEVTMVLEGVQQIFKTNPNARLAFSFESIPDNPFGITPVNSNIPASVHKRIVYILRDALEKVVEQPIPVAPALLTVLADMQTPGKWPMFSTQDEMLSLIERAIAGKFTPPSATVGDSTVARNVVQAIAEITRRMLESRRDVVVVRLHDGKYMSINHPNWLTEKLLGSLFDPAKRPVVGEAAAARVVLHHNERSHLLSVDDIWLATSAALDSRTRETLEKDRDLIPNLLQHLGICIPVVVENNLARGVAQGDRLADAKHWFPSFSILPMEAGDGVVPEKADHIIAREFKLLHTEVCSFPPGYFSSLSVSIVSMYPTSNLVQLYKDGMEVQSSSDNVHIIVRRGDRDKNSFVVIVATIGEPLGSSRAFSTMEAIKTFIYGNDSWRGNVEVEEYGLHPIELQEAAGIPITTLKDRLINPSERAENLHFFFGVEKHSDLGLIPYQLHDVLESLGALHHKLDQQHSEVLLRFDALGQRLDYVWDAVSDLESTLHAAEASSATNVTDVQALAQTLSDALVRSQSATAGSTSSGLPDAALATLNATSTAVASLLESIKDHRKQFQANEPAANCSEEQLQALKSLWMDEFRSITDSMQKATFQRLRQLEDAQQTRLQFLLNRSHEAVLKDLLNDNRQLREQLRTLNNAQDSDVSKRLDVVQRTLDALSLTADKERYSICELPMLAEIGKAEPKGTAKDYIRRQLFEVSRLYFVCPACGERAQSGEHGKGYLLRATKEWVQNVAVVLEVTLFALQVVSLATPLPLPRVAELSQYLPIDRTSELDSTLKFLTLRATRNTVAREDTTTMPAAGRKLDAHPVITKAHVEAVRTILLKLGESVPPQHTGLKPIICSANKQCAWVCPACEQKYETEGDQCLKISPNLV